MIIVTCNGCFDGLHPGHLFFLGFSRGQGDVLIVGINSDTYIQRHKRINPIPQLERKQALLDLGFIKEVVIFDEENPIQFISDVKPNIHCTGQEYEGRAVEATICNELGTKIVYVPRIGKWSTTALKDSGQIQKKVI
jgi:D-beta-D-heptose 7-phosphate kinase/D-beta-D-heptose 1-phosphate adenosyltransferase